MGCSSSGRIIPLHGIDGRGFKSPTVHQRMENVMPRGLNRTDLNKTGISYRNGFPITLPHNFGNLITLPHDFGNDPPQDTPGNPVTLPKNFGNIIGPVVITPTFLSMSPDSGPTAGGTAIAILGTGFIAGTTVNIGGQPCTSVVVVSPTQITAVTPAGSQGLTDVSISNAGGGVDTANAWLYANGGSAIITVTSAQIQTLNSAPLSVVAGIVGAVPVVEAGFVIYNPGSTPYTVGANDVVALTTGPSLSAGNPPLINYTGFLAQGFVSGGFDPDGTIAFWNPSYQSETPSSPAKAAIPASNLVGASIFLTQHDSSLAWPSGTDWTSGNGTMTLFIEYSFIKG